MTKSSLIKPLLDKEYRSVVHGKGIYLYDEDGNEYIDGSSGAVTASIGHGVQEIIDAMLEQAKKVSFVYRSQFTTNVAEDLAMKICSLAPGNLNHAFFVNSGSEATENAFKIAIQYWSEKGRPTKKNIISRWMSYHGITIGALSMSGHKDRRKPFEQILEDYPSVSAPYYYRDGTGKSIEECDYYYANELEREIIRVGEENVAAFIAEPLVGSAGGVLTPSDNYLAKIKAVCDKYNVLFIADEVMTGIGRTGEMFAVNHWGIVPDMIATGKGMSAGYTPIAATIVSDEIVKTIKEGTNVIVGGHTYSANPQSAATSLAVLKYIEEHNLVKKSKDNGEYLKQQIENLSHTSKMIGDVRGKGLFVGVEFVKDKASKESFTRNQQIAERLVTECFNRGLLIYPGNAGVDGIGGDSIILSPPLTITKSEIDELVKRFKEALYSLEESLFNFIKE